MLTGASSAMICPKGDPEPEVVSNWQSPETLRAASSKIDDGTLDSIRLPPARLTVFEEAAAVWERFSEPPLLTSTAPLLVTPPATETFNRPPEIVSGPLPRDPATAAFTS